MTFKFCCEFVLYYDALERNVIGIIQGQEPFLPPPRTTLNTTVFSRVFQLFRKDYIVFDYKYFFTKYGK